MRWIQTSTKRTHTHTVHALLYLPRHHHLLTSSSDTSIIVAPLNARVDRIGVVEGLVASCESKRVVVGVVGKSVKVWRVAMTESYMADTIGVAGAFVDGGLVDDDAMVVDDETPVVEPAGVDSAAMDVDDDDTVDEEEEYDETEHVDDVDEDGKNLDHLEPSGDDSDNHHKKSLKAPLNPITGTFTVNPVKNIDVCSHKLLLTVNVVTPTAISAIAISPSGQFLAVADHERIQFFRTDLDETVSVSRLRTQVIESLGGAVSIVFTDNAMIAVGIDSVVKIMNLDTFIVQKIDFYADQRRGIESVRTVVADSTGRFIAVGDSGRRIVTYKSSKSGVFKLHHTLARYTHTHTSIAFNPTQAQLVTTTVGNEIHIVDVNTNVATKWSKHNSLDLPPHFLARRERIIGTVYLSPTRLVVYAATYVFVIDLKTKQRDWWLDHTMQGIMGAFRWTDELVVVERPAMAVLAELGGAFKRVRYGG